MNLDEFNALVSSLYADQDRALALQGLVLGCNKGACTEDAPAPFRRAWEVAITWRREAEEFKAKRSKGGQASAASRAAMNGTAQPSRTSPEQCSSSVQAVPEPIHNPQSTILNPPSVSQLRSETQSTNQDKKSTAPRGEKIIKEVNRGDMAAEVISIWNEVTSGKLSKAKVTPKRARAIASQTKEPGWLDDFKAACAFLVATPFYLGQNDRGWTADLDWVLKPGKATELAEKAAAPKNGVARGPVVQFRAQEAQDAFMSQMDKYLDANPELKLGDE